MPEGTVQVTISAPERENRTFECSEVLVPGSEGVFSVRAGHTPFLTMLIPGVVQLVDKKGEEAFYAVSHGFAEVRNDHVLILADTCEAGREIDVQRAEEARERAEKRLAKPDDDTDIMRAEYALFRSLARQQAGGRQSY
jgi:F-type H+-transporting ATPase subunit epsilon